MAQRDGFCSEEILIQVDFKSAAGINTQVAYANAKIRCDTVIEVCALNT